MVVFLFSQSNNSTFQQSVVQSWVHQANDWDMLVLDIVQLVLPKNTHANQNISHQNSIERMIWNLYVQLNLHMEEVRLEPFQILSPNIARWPLNCSAKTGINCPISLQFLVYVNPNTVKCLLFHYYHTPNQLIYFVSFSCNMFTFVVM